MVSNETTKAKTKARKRVLYLEDDSFFGQIHTKSIKAEGYTVSYASTVEGAKQLFDESIQNKTPFDVLLTDYIIFRTTSEGLVKYIKSKQPGVPIILHSGISSEILIGKLTEPDLFFRIFRKGSLSETKERIISSLKEAIEIKEDSRHLSSSGFSKSFAKLPAPKKQNLLMRVLRKLTS